MSSQSTEPMFDSTRSWSSSEVALADDISSSATTPASTDMASSTKREPIPSLVRNVDLQALYSENVLAKILQVAEQGLKVPGSLSRYPHTVPATPDATGKYEYREADFWTCGFFPGSIYALLERAVKFPSHLPVPKWYREHVYTDLLTCGRHWSAALNEMSGRTDTHDMGFIVQPALQKDWELTGNPESLASIKRAAYALASRYDPNVGAIRSWDRAVNSKLHIENMDDNFLVIIDSMCNLDLLYYVGHLVEDDMLINIATQHADKVRQVLLREDYSTFHVANLDPRKGGATQTQMTHQGYKDHSTWTRGQGWAIMGFAQTYMWTKDKTYLDTAIACANLFLRRLGEGQHSHKWVPVWDFDAPQDTPTSPLRDTSAGVIAANGMLLIHQALQSLVGAKSVETAVGGDFLSAALAIVQDTIDLSLDRDFAAISPHGASSESTTGSKALHASIQLSGFEAILRNATVNNNEHTYERYFDQGLVYADYFLLEFGNKLCRMKLC